MMIYGNKKTHDNVTNCNKRYGSRNQFINHNTTDDNMSNNNSTDNHIDTNSKMEVVNYL